MEKVFADRKNRGNITYRITVYDKSGRIFIELEKLMKVRSKEKDKKVTKKSIFMSSFYADEFKSIQTEISDELMTEFCIETIKKVQTDDR